MTDIHEISYQITKQYYERIHPTIEGTLPPGCIQGEQYLPLATFSSSTYLACVTLKTKGCCGQPCFCTDEGSPFTWGTPYTSNVDPTLSTGALGSTAPFIMNHASYVTGGIVGAMTPYISGSMLEPEAFDEGYYNNYNCTSDSLACCGQNTHGLVYGCTDPYAFNWDCKSSTYATGNNLPNPGVPCGDGVNTDDGSCVYVYGTGPGECIWGCMNSGGGNYEVNATCYSACT